MTMPPLIPDALAKLESMLAAHVAENGDLLGIEVDPADLAALLAAARRLEELEGGLRELIGPWTTCNNGYARPYALELEALLRRVGKATP